MSTEIDTYFTEVLWTEIDTEAPEISVSYIDTEIDSESTSVWCNYKVLGLCSGIFLGLIAFWFWYWYWFNNSPGVDGASAETSTSTSTFDISSITYDDRYAVRRSIRDSLFENIRLSTQLHERNEELALESINLNTPVSREEMIQRIIDSDVSPNTAIDAVQYLLREAAREAAREVDETSQSLLIEATQGVNETSLYSNALIPYNSITDLVIYNPENIPIPDSVDLNRYDVFIQYLDHYNAIIAAYDLNILL